MPHLGPDFAVKKSIIVAACPRGLVMRRRRAAASRNVGEARILPSPPPGQELRAEAEGNRPVDTLANDSLPMQPAAAEQSRTGRLKKREEEHPRIVDLYRIVRLILPCLSVLARIGCLSSALSPFPSLPFHSLLPFPCLCGVCVFGMTLNGAATQHEPDLGQFPVVRFSPSPFLPSFPSPFSSPISRLGKDKCHLV